MSRDRYRRCGRHGYFEKKCRSSARSVKTVDDSDTEDLEINNKPVCFQLDTGVMCCH